MLIPELRALIARGPLAHLVTVNSDGSPQVSVVWIGLDGDEIVSGHMYNRIKLRNVRRDPRVAISLEAGSPPGTFLADYAVLHGTARVTEGGAAELLHRLGKVYVAPDFVFPVTAPPDAGFVLRTRVERVTGHGRGRRLHDKNWSGSTTGSRPARGWSQSPGTRSARWGRTPDRPAPGRGRTSR